MKIVINKRLEGFFGLSTKAMIELIKRKSKGIFFVDKEIWESVDGSLGSKKLKSIDGYKIVSEDILYKNGLIYIFDELKRNDPDLVSVVEKMGKESYGSDSELKIIEIPDDIEWYIDQFARSGEEEIHEKHRVWRNGEKDRAFGTCDN